MSTVATQKAQAPSYWIELHLSGPIEVAKQILRQDFMREGFCVTITPTTYLYKGGEEAGYIVGILNYPRFPLEPEALVARARDLMMKLLEGTFQDSALMMTPETTEWISRRLEAKNES